MAAVAHVLGSSSLNLPGYLPFIYLYVLLYPRGGEEALETKKVDGEGGARGPEANERTSRWLLARVIACFAKLLPSYFPASP